MLTQFCRWLNRSISKTQKRRNPARSIRRLSFLEALEERRVMAVTDLGTITDGGSAQDSGTLDGLGSGYLLYKFQVAQPSQTTISLSSLTKAVNVSFAIDYNPANGNYDQAEVLESASNSGFFGSISDHITPLTEYLQPNFTYFVRVDGTNFKATDSTSYALQIAATNVPNAQDAGGTLNATPFDTGATNIGTLTTTPLSYTDIAQPGDLDIYQFSLATPSAVTVDFTQVTGYISSQLITNFHNAIKIDTDELLENTSYSSPGTFTMELEPGTYSLLVQSTSQFSGQTKTATYQVQFSSLTLTNNSDAGDLASNATKVNALTGTPSPEYLDILQPGDEDWYQFQIADPSSFSVSIAQLGTNGQCTIYAADGATILDSRSVTAGSSFSDAFEIGTYYLRIKNATSFGGSAIAGSRYTLDLAATKISNAQNAGDSATLATDLGYVTNKPQTRDDIAQVNDQDWYRFRLFDTTNASITIPKPSNYVTLTIYKDVNGDGSALSVINSSTGGNGNGDAAVTLTSAAAGIYLAKITPGGFGNYVNIHYQISFVSDLLAPQLEVRDVSNNLIATGTSYDFGSVDVGSPTVTRTLTVKNTGDGKLVLQPIVYTGTASDLFTIVNNFTADQTLNKGETASFSIQFSTSKVGQASGSLSFINSDSSLSPFQIDLAGKVFAIGAIPPQVNSLGTAISFKEKGKPTAISSSVTISDADSKNFDQGQLTLSISGNSDSNDRLEIQTRDTISVNANTITCGGKIIGTFQGGSGSTPLTVALTANATPAAVQALLRHVTFRILGPNPNSKPRTLSVTLADGKGGVSTAVSETINVVPVNDPPQLILSGTVKYTENYPALLLVSAGTISDVDSADFKNGNLTFTIAVNSTADDLLEIRNQGANAGQIGIDTIQKSVSFGGKPIGTYLWQPGTNPKLVVSFTTADATPTAAQAVLRNVTFRTNSETPSNLQRTVSATVQDNLNGVSSVHNKYIQVVPVNDAPLLGGTPVKTIPYTHDSKAIYIAPGGFVSDVDSPNFNTGSLTVHILQGVNSTILLGIDAQKFTVNATTRDIKENASNTSIGTLDSVKKGNGTDLIITFNSNATPALATKLVQALTFKTSGGAAGSAQITLSVKDDHNAASFQKNVSISIT